MKTWNELVHRNGVTTNQQIRYWTSSGQGRKKNNCYSVYDENTRLTAFYSYATIIAFKAADGTVYERDDVNSCTTGKHRSHFRRYAYQTNSIQKGIDGKSFWKLMREHNIPHTMAYFGSGYDYAYRS